MPRILDELLASAEGLRDSDARAADRARSGAAVELSRRHAARQLFLTTNREAVASCTSRIARRSIAD
jgi:hypothetical protein